MQGKARSPALAMLSLSLAFVLAILLWSELADTRNTAVAQPLIDVTDDAVQTFYQSGVPHTDRTGNPTITYEPGESFFPIGVYYPGVCHIEHYFTWSPYTGGSPDWNGTYELFINLGSSFQTGDRIDVHQSTHTATSTTVHRLPADTDLYYRVIPNPWQLFDSDPPLAEGTFDDPCPPTDVEDANVVDTMANAGFNLAITFFVDHPQLFLALKDSGGVTDFKFVVDARHPPPPAPPPRLEFPDQLFDPVSQGGQGYSEHPDIYGWQLEDGPLQGAGCDPEAEQEALDRLAQKYNDHEVDTDQVIFHVEGAPSFSCDSPNWDLSADIEDAANHDH